MEHFKDFSKEVIDRLARIETKLDNTIDKVLIHDKALNGNGNKGIKARLAGLEVKMCLIGALAGFIGSLILGYIK